MDFFFRELILVFRHPLHQRVQDDLSDDKTTIEALVIDHVRIPFAEHVIRAFVNGMRVIVGTWVECQFVEMGRSKVSGTENICRSFR